MERTEAESRMKGGQVMRHLVRAEDETQITMPKSPIACCLKSVIKL